MTKHTIYRRFLAISACVMCLGLSAPASADTIGYSYLELDNFTVSNNATGNQLDASDFSALDIGDSSSASAVTTFGGPAVSASPNSLETALACSGDTACPAIAENDSAQQAVSNFGRGDTFGNGGTIISNLPGPDFVNVWTVAEGRQNTTGSTTAQSGTRNTTEFTFELAADTEVRIDFDGLAELYVQLDQDLVQTQASYNWNATIIDVATGATVFNWVPNGTLGTITGGTELSDPFSMNNSRGLVSTGSDGTGPQSGAFAALVTLAGQTEYRLTIGHGSQINTEVEPVILAQLGDRVWEDRDADGIQDCQDTNGNGIIGDAGDTGPECDAGIPDIVVNLLDGDCSTPIGPQTITDADGFYLFDNLDPGDYCVEFVKPGDDFCQIGIFNPGSPQFTEKNAGGDDAVDSDADTGTGASDAVNLAAGESDLTVDAGIYCPAKLGDMLIEDLDRDGIQDPGEPGIPDQEVQLLMCVGGLPGAVLQVTTTDADGMYMFNPLAPGEYAVIFSKPDGTVYSPQDQGGDDTVDCDTDMNGLSQCVTLGTREYNDTVDACVNRPPAGLGDRVWEDKDADGIQDPGEPGIPDVPVSLLGPGNDGDCNTGDEVVLDTTLTDANGLYEFINLEPGRYCVEFEKPDICNPIIGGDSTFSPRDQGGDDAADSDADTTTGQTGNIDLDPNEFDPTNDAGVYCPAKIGDLVWNDLNEDGIQEDGVEPGKEGVAVNLYDCGPDGLRGTVDDGGPAGSTSTDVNGMYMFNPLPPGNYSIECVKPDGYMFSPQDQGGDDAADSDADPATGQTVCTTLESNEWDPTWDCGLFEPQAPGIDIEKATNGVDADDANAGDAPQVAPGELVTWTYKVTNTGNVDLVNVIVTDDQNVPVTCPQDTLAVAEMMTCEASGVAEDLMNTGFTTVPGLCGGVPNSPLYENMGMATGDTERGDFVEDDDPSHYCNPPGGGGEGCTPGFWKNPKHFVAWFNPPYDPSTLFSDVFEDAFPGMTLLGVLSQGGGGLKALGRHSVAALLNTATADVDYDIGTPAEVIAAFNAAYLGGDADEIEDLKDQLDFFNNLGCPINGKSPPSNL